MYPVLWASPLPKCSFCEPYPCQPLFPECRLPFHCNPGLKDTVSKRTIVITHFSSLQLAFLASVTPVIHDFWNEKSKSSQEESGAHFFKVFYSSTLLLKRAVAVSEPHCPLAQHCIIYSITKVSIVHWATAHEIESVYMAPSC